MVLKFKVEGLEKVQTALKRDSRLTQQVVESSLEKTAFFMEGQVKKSIAGREGEPTSVDTGRLLGSVKGVSDDETAAIFTNVEYAKFIEFGTISITARKHFRNSLDRNVRKIRDFFASALRRVSN